MGEVNPQKKCEFWLIKKLDTKFITQTGHRKSWELLESC
jgi:hypothetical protein